MDLYHIDIRLHGALKFNGGGHLNHSIFWQNLCPGGLKANIVMTKFNFFFPGSGEPEGELEAAIVRDFGSVAAMKEKLSASTVAVQVCLSHCSALVESWSIC